MHHWFSHPAVFMLLGEITRVARQSATSAPSAVIASMLAVLCATFVAVRPAHADAVVYRVNVGGPAIAPLDAGPAWGEDTGASPSAYVNYPASGNWFGGTDQPMGAPHASVPAWVPAAVFDDERWDLDSGPEMQWEFPVANGSYRVNLFFAEGCTCAQFANGRKFDVAIENDLMLDDFDVFATYGGFRPGMQTFLATVTDGGLSIEFRHGPRRDNPRERHRAESVLCFAIRFDGA